jgi:hypothetical protein
VGKGYREGVLRLNHVREDLILKYNSGTNNHMQLNQFTNNHSRDPKTVDVVEGWSLFSGSFMLNTLKSGSKSCACFKQVVAIRRRSLAEV